MPRAGADDMDGGYRGHSKGSLLSAELDGDRHWQGSLNSRQDSPGVSTMPVADAHVAVVASMAGAVLSSGRSVQQGLRICVPAPPPGTGAASNAIDGDAAVLTTDSAQALKPPVKAEPPARAHSEGARQGQVCSALPSHSQWAMRFSSGVSSWDLSSGGAAGAGSTIQGAEAAVAADGSAVPAGGVPKPSDSSAACADAALGPPQLLPPPQAEQQSAQSSPAVLLPARHGTLTLRQRATAIPARPQSVPAAAPEGAAQVGETVCASAGAPARRWRSHFRQPSAAAEVAARPWSVGPSPVHTPQATSSRAEPVPSSSKLVWTKGLWSVDGSLSSHGEAQSTSGGVHTGPTASEIASNTTRSRDRSGNGGTLAVSATDGDGDIQVSASDDVMPQSTDIGLDCYRSSTVITSIEQPPSVVSRGEVAPERRQPAMEQYGSVSDGSTLPGVAVGSGMASMVSTGVPPLPPKPPAAPSDLGFCGLELQVSELMQHVQMLQQQAAEAGGGAGAMMEQPAEVGGQSQGASGGTSLGSFLEVPSELRADPSGSVNFIYGGGVAVPQVEHR